eukprot:5594833-Pleurochrysis_carterae.AAC.1
MGNVSAELERRLAPAFVGKEASIQETVREVLNIFNGLETSALEESSLKRSVPFIAPTERRLGSHTEYVTDAEGFKLRGKTKVDHCYDLALSDTTG